ncbi:MFS transporter [Micromonospora endophytica]|uniref:MFS transporter n=1 Tax=Micromonospora endophytica TaxID=515350 RepID=UPI001C339203|nr:MFS transporter [Micromonospora endophytica]BCJ62408.1 hypothetical protein Jiend_58300 [Micromonospora endophytica]
MDGEDDVVATTGAGTTVPPAYWTWLGGTTLSLLGVQAMAFAMAWTAAGQGGRFAALVLSAIVAPRVLLLLVGGAVADRFGPWIVLVLSDAAMIVVMAALAVAVWSPADPGLPLLLTALAIGIVDAFYLPSTGAMPRRLVPADGLARAMSARHLAGQLALFAGPAAGGLFLAGLGLAGVALANAATFAVLLAVLVALRPYAARAGSDGGPEPARSVGRAALDGLRVAAAHPVLRPTLLLVGVAAGFLLPVTGLLVPLLARERSWPPQVAGVVVAALALGTAGVAVLVLLRGALADPGRVAAVSLLVAAGGVAALAAAGSPVGAVVAGAVVGLGSGGFATHVGPLVLAATPATHLSRVQAVLVLVQNLPLVLTTNAFGVFVETTRTASVLYACAGVLATAALAALTPSRRQDP